MRHPKIHFEEKKKKILEKNKEDFWGPERVLTEEKHLLHTQSTMVKFTTHVMPQIAFGVNLKHKSKL